MPFATGGATDILGRLIGRGMEGTIGQPVIVENRPGAAGAIGAARARPGTLSYMSTGQNGPLHVGIEYLTKRAGVKMIHVPYKGEAPAFGDLVGGRIDVAVMTVPFTKPQIAAGKLRAIATISAQRARGMPDVPSVAEQGYPGYAVPIWNGLSVPSGTPADAMTVLNRAANAALRDPAIVQRMLELGVAPIGGAPADFAVMLRRERQRWELMIKETGVLSG